VLGTQMERHIAKRLGVPCAVISAPVHVQDFPARYSPQMGFEGANVLFDTWVHPLMMGLEEHLIGMFRGDFEFHDGRGALAPRPRRRTRGACAPAIRTPSPFPTGGPSARPDRPRPYAAATAAAASRARPAGTARPRRRWARMPKGAAKIPFFVRGKARRNTEKFAPNAACH
jgi:light-independent protochlorophyllide reductase subunit B